MDTVFGEHLVKWKEPEEADPDAADGEAGVGQKNYT